MRNGPCSVGSVGVGDLRHQPLHAHPVADQVGHGDHQQLVPLRELRQLGHARHAAVGVGRSRRSRRPGRGRRCAPGRRPPRSARPAPARRRRGPAAGTRARAGPGPRPGLAVDRGEDGGRAIGRRDAGGGAAPRLDADAERGVERRGVALGGTCSGISSSSSRSGVIGMQIRPRPWVIMKLIALGVTFSAAMVRSPSFSRSSSSTTITISPRRMASTASSTEANGASRCARPAPRSRRRLAAAVVGHRAFASLPAARSAAPQFRPRDVLAEHVALEVHLVARRFSVRASCASRCRE